MRVKADLTSVGHFEPIKDGVYPFRVIEVEAKQSASGKSYLSWKLKVFNADDATQNGKQIIHNTPIEGKGAFILQQFINAVDDTLSPNEFDTDDVIGKAVECRVAQVESPDGRTFPRVLSCASYVAPDSIANSFDGFPG